MQFDLSSPISIQFLIVQSFLLFLNNDKICETKNECYDVFEFILGKDFTKGFSSLFKRGVYYACTKSSCYRFTISIRNKLHTASINSRFEFQFFSILCSHTQKKSVASNSHLTFISTMTEFILQLLKHLTFNSCVQSMHINWYMRRITTCWIEDDIKR